MSLLSKGLNFCPHAHCDPINTILDINKFVRNLTVHRHYFKEDEDIQMNNEDTDVQSANNNVFSFSENCATVDMENLLIEQPFLSGRETDRGSTRRVLFRVPSDFDLIQSHSPDIDKFQRLVERGLFDLATHMLFQSQIKEDNLSITERSALKALMESETIMIQNADKGGSVVVLDTTTYREKALRQLNNTDTYISNKTKNLVVVIIQYKQGK